MMKNLYLIIAVVLTFGITSCSMLKKGSNDHEESTTISKEQMQADAYAMANIECDYKLKFQQLAENDKDRRLKEEFNKVKDNIAAFTRLINNRYRKSPDLRKQFEKMVESARSELTICAELEAYEEEKALKKAEMEADEKAKSEGKK